jgi:hypothetical protein
MQIPGVSPPHEGNRFIGGPFPIPAERGTVASVGHLEESDDKIVWRQVPDGHLHSLRYVRFRVQAAADPSLQSHTAPIVLADWEGQGVPFWF